tara:strand:- start:652 stop:948 length:297 start_codon:yes stop_codon:yes gene_type:complete
LIFPDQVGILICTNAKGIVMVEKIESYDAITRLSEILRRVEAGESFTITNRGKDVADVVPSVGNNPLQIIRAIANIKKAQKTKVSDSELKWMTQLGQK